MVVVQVVVAVVVLTSEVVVVKLDVLVLSVVRYTVVVLVSVVLPQAAQDAPEADWSPLGSHGRAVWTGVAVESPWEWPKDCHSAHPVGSGAVIEVVFGSAELQAPQPWCLKP